MHHGVVQHRRIMLIVQRIRITRPLRRLLSLGPRIRRSRLGLLLRLSIFRLRVGIGLESRIKAVEMIQHRLQQRIGRQRFARNPRLRRARAESHR